MEGSENEQDEYQGRSHVAPQEGDSLTYKLKIYAPFVTLAILLVGFTWFFTSYDKRISHLETFASGITAQVQANTDDITVIKEWVPVANLKFDLLLQHFGIEVPKLPVPHT
jgi:hypothetical protein